jgi:3-oxoadipate enol-lactonase
MGATEVSLVGSAPRIAVEHAGAGPLVVLMHGIGGNRANWTDQVAALADRFHVAAWDARGYGGSDDYEGALDFATFSADLARVLDHFGERSAHLVGLSMGGIIAQDFYRRSPERVRSLVLADTRNRIERHNSDEFLRQREAPLLAGLTPADIAPRLARALAGPNASAEALERLRASVAALRKDSYLKVLRATTKILEHPDFRGRSTFLDLEKVTVPTLVICGTEDTVTPPELSRAIVDAVAGARIAWIEGAGHLSNIENPREFNRALRDFLLEQPG